MSPAISMQSEPRWCRSAHEWCRSAHEWCRSGQNDAGQGTNGAGQGTNGAGRRFGVPPAPRNALLYTLMAQVCHYFPDLRHPRTSPRPIATSIALDARPPSSRQNHEKSRFTASRKNGHRSHSRAYFSIKRFIFHETDKFSFLCRKNVMKTPLQITQDEQTGRIPVHSDVFIVDADIFLCQDLVRNASHKESTHPNPIVI